MSSKEIRVKRTLFTFSKFHRKSAPQFLLDIYKKLKLATEDGDEDEDHRVKRDAIENEIYLSPADQYAIDESDIIMTFLNKSKIYSHNLDDETKFSLSLRSSCT